MVPCPQFRIDLPNEWNVVFSAQFVALVYCIFAYALGTLATEFVCVVGVGGLHAFTCLGTAI